MQRELESRSFIIKYPPNLHRSDGWVLGPMVRVLPVLIFAVLIGSSCATAGFDGSFVARSPLLARRGGRGQVVSERSGAACRNTVRAWLGGRVRFVGGTSVQVAVRLSVAFHNRLSRGKKEKATRLLVQTLQRKCCFFF